MKIKRFFATDIRQVMRMVKDELGADAVIMSNRSVDGGVEIVAARDFDEQLVHENLKKQQQHQATQKRSEMTDFAVEKDSVHVVSSARKSAEEPEPILRPGVRRKLDEYVGYAEKAELNSMKSITLANSFGSQIRSYVMHPYSMVKDHRTNIESGNVGKVMDGSIDKFINGYLKLAARGDI